MDDADVGFRCLIAVEDADVLIVIEDVDVGSMRLIAVEDADALIVIEVSCI
ncbi:hypothetical protein [uncultured Duncaniella sp.]|nr:hypothetical protein [uncultured Duncaniella sp.]